MDQSQPQSRVAGRGIIVRTPVWLSVIRGFQFGFAFIILALSGYIVHDLYLDCLGFAIAIALCTWVITIYSVTTEKITAWHPAYNVYAVLSLDGFLIIMWLAAFADVAATRSDFVYPTEAKCTSDGADINSGECVVVKRGAFMSYGALDMMSTAAGLGALEMINFIVTFVYILVKYLKLRRSAPAILVAGGSGVEMEHKQPFLSQAYVSQTQPAHPYADTQQQHPLYQNPPPTQMYQSTPQQMPVYNQQPVYESQRVLPAHPPAVQQVSGYPSYPAVSPPGAASMTSPPVQQSYQYHPQ